MLARSPSKIADFVLSGKGIWWEQRDDIIELYDSPSALGERPEHGKTTGFLVGSRDEIGDAEVEDIP